jgi:hypothetical protein
VREGIAGRLMVMAKPSLQAARNGARLLLGAGDHPFRGAILQRPVALRAADDEAGESGLPHGTGMMTRLAICHPFSVFTSIWFITNRVVSPVWPAGPIVNTTGT